MTRRLGLASHLKHFPLIEPIHPPGMDRLSLPVQQHMDTQATLVDTGLGNPAHLLSQDRLIQPTGPVVAASVLSDN